MLKAFARIVIILFTVGVYGSTDYQPTAFIKDTKLIGSLHQNNEVEMFLGIPYALPPINDLRWETPVAWTPKNKKEGLFGVHKKGVEVKQVQIRREVSV